MDCDIFNHSLFICYSTTNYNTLSTMCIESLHRCGFYNIDHAVSNPSEDLLKATGFQSDLWYYCLKEKIKHLVTTITNKKTSNIKYFMFNDCDVMFIEKHKDKWSDLQNIIDMDDKDIFFMRESTTNEVNSGFFIIKNNDKIDSIISFFNKVIIEFENSKKEDIPFGDQSIINKLKNEINYNFIPNDYAVFGACIYNKNKSLFHHAVCTKDVGDKLTQINYIKTFFV